MSNGRLLSVKDLVVEYVSDGYSVRPLDHFNMHADRGELVALLGPSGSGKTTLLSVLSAMVPATEGTVTVNDVDVLALTGSELEDYRRNSIGIVFQGFNLIPSLTAIENVAAPLLVTGTKRGPALARAGELLDAVGLADRASHRPTELSGGQQQRVAVARGLIGDPLLLLADEPTANLDLISAEAVIGLLRNLRDQGRTIVISTHDTRLIPAADRVVEMTRPSEAPGEKPLQVVCRTGEVLFRQGDASDFVYMITSGSVDILRERYDGSQEPLAVLEAGTYVGELGPLLGFPRSATVKARELTTLDPITVQEFKAMRLQAASPEADPSRADTTTIQL